MANLTFAFSAADSARFLLLKARYGYSDRTNAATMRHFLDAIEREDRLSPPTTPLLPAASVASHTNLPKAVLKPPANMSPLTAELSVLIGETPVPANDSEEKSNYESVSYCWEKGFSFSEEHATRANAYAGKHGLATPEGGFVAQ